MQVHGLQNSAGTMAASLVLQHGFALKSAVGIASLPVRQRQVRQSAQQSLLQPARQTQAARLAMPA